MAGNSLAAGMTFALDHFVHATRVYVEKRCDTMLEFTSPIAQPDFYGVIKR